MKPDGYWDCCNDILDCRLPEPWRYQAFTSYFETVGLDDVRDYYGRDLYNLCFWDVQKRVVKMDEVIVELREHGVSCKAIFAPDDCHVDYVAIFNCGELSPAEITKIIQAHDTFNMFQCKL